MNPSEQITERIASVKDWRGPVLAQVRKLVLEAAPNLTEEWKWNTPVWSFQGLVCSVGTFKDKVKINFFQGALIEDKQNLFNAGLDAKASRAIDIGEGENIKEAAFKTLVRKAVAFNTSNQKKK